MKPRNRMALALLSLPLLLAALPLVAGGDEESGAAAPAAAEITAVAGTPFVDHIWASPADYETGDRQHHRRVSRVAAVGGRGWRRVSCRR